MEAATEHTLHHFSHQHPLERTVSPSNGIVACYGCNLRIESGTCCYNCKTCSFSLHQVCSNMPKQRCHPSHPNHYLTLLVSPPSADATFTCKACDHHVEGFYYNCAQCDIYYHILCSALPLSVAVHSHPHALKIEFSPPYDFSCDLCDQPSSKGWLYRCRFCEFDAHISCAISNHKQQAFPMPDTSKIDYGAESKELMQLVVRGFAKRTEDGNDREVIHSAVTGWDERLHSSREHLKIKNPTDLPGLYQTKPYMPKTSATPEEQSRDQDPSMFSEDLTIASYQFSDYCFSIDLLKSYSNHDNAYQENKETSYQDIKDVREVEAKISYGNEVVASNNSSDLQAAQLRDHPNKAVLNPLYRGPENRSNQAFLAGSFNHRDEKLSQNQGSGVTELSNKSNEASSRYSCWKFLRCFSSPRYEKCSKSFKNRGL